MDEQIESNYILSRDGLKLNCIISDIEFPKAVVCILHGHGEHVGRYQHVIDFLNRKGFACVAMDFRGHGLSEGKRGHVRSMDYLLDDVEEALKYSRAKYLDIPMYLFGHSFGGCVALNYVLKKPKSELTGFIASSPWLALAFEPPKWKVNMGNLLAGILPKISLKSELDSSDLSKKDGVKETYDEDPLVHNKITAKFFQEVSLANAYAIAHAREVSLPGLIYHGNADKIIDCGTTRAFAENAKQCVEFHELEGVYHEPHNDVEQEQVMDLIVSFLSEKEDS